jgi:UDP-3-O-[3-hydroxymyristoyl] glucosamine N-acyltransferase
MQATLAELAVLVDGRVIGNPELVICDAAPLHEAQPGHITLLDRVEKSQLLSKTRASAVIVPASYEPVGIPAIQVADTHVAFARIIGCFRPTRVPSRRGVSPSAVIHPAAILAEDVEIHPFVSIAEDVEIGAGATIHAGVHIMAGVTIGPGTIVFPNVVLYENTIVGARCIIHSGAVLGAYGFGYNFVEGRHRLAAQLGKVVIGDDVEIGANSTIDRGTYGATTIGEGTKVDNQVMIAHNCRIGRHNLLCSQVGIAGSTTTGDYVVMAGQVGVRDHVHIGEGAVLGAMAGVINDVPAGSRLVGIPATPEREQMVKQAVLAKLPEMRKQLKQLQAQVEQLAARLAAAAPAAAEIPAPEAGDDPAGRSAA